MNRGRKQYGKQRQSLSRARPEIPLVLGNEYKMAGVGKRQSNNLKYSLWYQNEATLENYGKQFHFPSNTLAFQQSLKTGVCPDDMTTYLAEVSSQGRLSSTGVTQTGSLSVARSVDTKSSRISQKSGTSKSEELILHKVCPRNHRQTFLPRIPNKYLKY